VLLRPWGKRVKWDGTIYSIGLQRPTIDGGPKKYQKPLVPFVVFVVLFLSMAVNPELLKILVCPLCKAPVNLTEDGQGLKCSQCRRVYPIRDDIPVMLINEAKVED